MTDRAVPPPERANERRLILFAVGALGVSCVVTQLVLMRELLATLAGNELVLGIVLGNWLLLMGAGAWLGRRAERQTGRMGSFLWLQILIAILPLCQVFAARVLWNEVLPRGAAAGPGATVLGSFVLLLPYCLAAGFLLALACAILAGAGQGAAGAGRVYIADTLGSIVGGAVFSLVLAWVLDSFALLAGVGFVNLAVALWLAWRLRRPVFIAGALAGGALLGFVAFVAKADFATTELQYPSEAVLFRGNSPYGQVVVTKAGGQINFYQNGAPVVCTHNTAEIEEAVHYGMAQRPAARNVLLVGGAVAGAANELLKYPAAITCVELDPLFLALGRRFLPENLADPRIRVVNTDGRRFVQTSPALFDVILVDLPDPTTAQLNRFHTAGFFAEVKRALATNGVLALAVGRYENAVSPELGQVLATAHRTLAGAFRNVLVIPGGRVFFLASGGPLDRDIAGRLERAGISTRLVNRHYLDAALAPDRVADLERAVAREGRVNRDFNPVLYFECLRLWASQFNARPGIFTGVAALALVLYVGRLRGAAVVLFASGFGAASLEVVLLLAFQALCGSVYYQLAVIVTVFMAGLAAGAAWAARRALATRRLLAVLAMGVAAGGVLLPAVLLLLRCAAGLGGYPLIVQATIAALTFGLAAVVGAQFPLANRIEFAGTNAAASRLYAADFVGAFTGAVLTSAFLIPWLGVLGVCLVASAINGVAGGMLFWRKAAT